MCWRGLLHMGKFNYCISSCVTAKFTHENHKEFLLLACTEVSWVKSHADRSKDSFFAFL